MQELAHGALLHGMHEAGRELGQRHEHERAAVRLGMRHDEIGVLEDLVAVEEQVEVDGARAPLAFAGASESLLGEEQVECADAPLRLTVDMTLAFAIAVLLPATTATGQTYRYTTMPPGYLTTDTKAYCAGFGSRANGRIQSRGLASVIVRAERMVWVARRDLAPGDEISPADLMAENRIFERTPSRLFRFDPEESWRVTRAVTAGQQVRSDQVEPVPDVEAGAPIWLLARTGTATVSVAGTARQSGDVGKTILVHNPVTGSLVRAVILDPESAELVASTTPRGGTR